MNRPKVLFLIILLCFFGAALIRMNNNFRFTPACGYDASGHLAYMYQIKSGWGIPLGNEGWCTFHTPLYYLMTAGVWKTLGDKSPWPVHIILRLVSTLSNLATALLALLSINLLWPKKSFIMLLGICFILFVPLHIYSSSMVGNEHLTAFLISIGLWLLILYQHKPHFYPVLAILMGLISGLALLSKYTGILILITILICLLQRILFNKERRKEHVFTLITVVIICLFISGGFYMRNMLLFGHPFVLSQDYPVVAKAMKQQPPGERRWADFLGFDLRIFCDPIVQYPQENIPNSRSRYIWSLVYSDFWFESFSHFFLLKCDPWRERVGIILLWLGIFPTLLFLLEIGKETALNLKKRMDTPTFPLLVLFSLNLMAFIIFNIKTPHFSAGKASYFLASTIPIAIFMGRGAEQWLQKRMIFKIIGIFFLILIFALSSAAFFLTYT